MGDSGRKEREIHIGAASVKPSSHDKTNHMEPTEQAVGSRQCTAGKTVPAQKKLERASYESPRKKRRSIAPTGPTAPVPRRRSSVPVRRKGQDLISFHRQSCQLFQSLEGTLASSHESTSDTSHSRSRHASTPSSRPSSSCVIKTENGFAYLTSTPSIPRFGPASISRRNSSAVTSLPQCFYGVSTSPTTHSSFSSLARTSSSNSGEAPTFPLALPPLRPHPVSTMSWTSVESRRFEYKKIDRSHGGLRGLWKKLTPRWCHGRCTRRGFFDGKDSKAESVRRYRMSLDDDDNDSEKRSQYNAKVEKKPREKRGKWACLSLLR